MSTQELILHRLRERDISLLLRLHHGFESRAVRRALALTSRLGDGIFWYALILTLAASGPVGRATAFQMATTGFVLTAIYKLMKHGIARPRPCDVHAEIRAIVPPLDRFSFPSGHTMHAVAFTFLATATFPLLGLLLIPFTLLIMLSRMVLGLHYPSDVLAGAAIGMGAAALSTLL